MSETGKCCICGGPYEHFGNNPEPVHTPQEGRCCDACNDGVVIPLRLAIVMRQRITSVFQPSGGRRKHARKQAG